MGPPQISFCAYYMYMGPLRSVSSRTIGGPIRSAFSLTIWGPAPSSQFLRLLYGGLAPKVSFFAHCVGAPRSVFSHTIWGPPSGQFLCLLYMEPPQISFFAHYVGAPSDQFLCLLDQFLRVLYGPPRMSFFAFYMGPPQISLFAYYMGPPPLKSVSSLTVWGAPSGQ